MNKFNYHGRTGDNVVIHLTLVLCSIKDTHTSWSISHGSDIIWMNKNSYCDHHNYGNNNRIELNAISIFVFVCLVICSFICFLFDFSYIEWGFIFQIKWSYHNEAISFKMPVNVHFQNNCVCVERSNLIPFEVKKKLNKCQNIKKRTYHWKYY